MAERRRQTRDIHFMGMAWYVASMGTCDRRRVGCVLVDEDHHVLSTGYNGAPPGKPHCDEVGHLMHKESCVRTVHAEANAVGRAAKKGNALNGCTAYVTAHPCIECIKLLIAAGCQRVVYGEPYHEDKDEISSTIAHGLLKIEFLEIRGGVQCG